MEFKAKPIPASTQPIIYDSSLCLNCNRCVQICQCDVLYPSTPTPIVMYPGECYYCGACVMVCPIKDAIQLVHPLMNQARFVPIDKEKNIPIDKEKNN